MSTKYAVARDRAYQWRTEYRKAKRENDKLRDVYAVSRELADAMRNEPMGTYVADILSRLRSAHRNAVFAEATTKDEV